MKKLKMSVMAASLLFASFLQTGCFGEFSLTRKIYEIHKGIGGDDISGRFLRTLLMYVGGIVYGVGMAIDAYILNLIEFWTGSNPLAMAPGEVETQTILRDGITYEMKATQNRFDITALDGAKAGETTSLVFNAETKEWNQVKNNMFTPLVKISDDNQTALMFNGNTMTSVNIGGVSASMN
jgi:hypothetical protein